MDNFDVSKIMDLIGNMSQEDLENSVKKATDIMNSKEKKEIPEIDIEMISKIQDIMYQLNSSSDDPDSKLLSALKPYLRNEKQDKLDQYMNLLKLKKVIGTLKPFDGGDNNNNGIK